MQSDHIQISSQGAGMSEALAAAERFGAEGGLDRKENLRLRLLAEELIGLMRGITGEVEADYWLERKDRAFSLHLKGDVTMNQEMRRQFLAASTSGKNAAAKGFMGKLRDMVAVLLLPGDPDAEMMAGMTLSMISDGSPLGYTAGTEAYAWTMSRYVAQVRERKENGGEAEVAWDELEKSIVANLADDVTVSIVDTTVEIVISKVF